MGWDIPIRAILSLMLVVGLIAAAGLFARRFGLQGGLLARKGGKRRLAIVESLILDNRRRLVLIRKDGAEHLLLLGGASDCVIDSTSHPAFTLAESMSGDSE